MADTPEAVTPAMYEVKNPLDSLKFNPVAAQDPKVAAAQQEALDAAEKMTQSLEERYANPNWFKVAAGFLKPQLGGFGASLGSASQALGENVEAQRAMAPTIERMRAQNAAYRAGIQTSTSQWDALQQARAKGEPSTTELERILAMDTTSEVGKSIVEKMRLDEAARARVQGKLSVQDTLQAKPYLSLNDPSIEFSRTPEEAKANIDSLQKLVPEGYDPKRWAATPPAQKLDALAREQNKRQDLVMEEGQVSAKNAEEAHNLLDIMAPTRQLAADPELAPIFSLGRNGDLFSQFRAFFNAKGGDTNAAIEGLTGAALEKYKNPTPQIREKVDKMVKGIAALEVKLRGGMINPTDASSFLNSQQSPSLQNSQAGFLGIMDNLGLNSYRTIELNHLRKKMGVPSAELMDVDAYRKFRNETRALATKLASQSALDSTPSFYYSDLTPAAPVATSPATPSRPATGGGAPATATAPSSSATINHDAVKAALAKKLAAQKP